ncbi:MAG TPA: hypothetical protein VID27_07305 [Blastocatellia bacterium]
MLRKKLASITLIASFALLVAVPDASAQQRCRTRFRNNFARSYYAPRPYYRTAYTRTYYAPRTYYRTGYVRSYYTPRSYYRSGYTRSYYAPRYYRDRRSRGNAAVTIIAPAAIGAGIGALVGGGKGAGIGALIGGGGGAAYYLLKNRRHHRRY